MNFRVNFLVRFASRPLFVWGSALEWFRKFFAVHAVFCIWGSSLALDLSRSVILGAQKLTQTSSKGFSREFLKCPVLERGEKQLAKCPFLQAKRPCFKTPLNWTGSFSFSLLKKKLGLPLECRRRTDVQQLTCNIDFSCYFYYFFFSFVLLELQPFVLKGKVLGEKFRKV